MDEVRRWLILIDELDACDPETSLILWFDSETGNPKMGQVAGPESDRDIAMRIIGRDIGAEPTDKGDEPSSKLAESMERLREKLFPPKPTPTAANDNTRPIAIDADSLLEMEFAPVKYVVPGYIAEGLTLLGGRPKLGKSWLALDIGVAVASGGRTLGADCQQGDCLYLALEDNPRRLQDRLKVILPKLRSARPSLSRLLLQTQAPQIGAGLIEAIDAWRKSVDDPRLVIVGTLAMVRPPKKRNQDSYEADYAVLSPLQRYASEHRLAILVVTHVRKAEAADPLEMISGTNGLTGATDAVLVLDRTTDGPKLVGRGRDVPDVEKALQFDGGKWTALGDAVEVKRSSQRRSILEALENAPGAMSPAEISKEIGASVASVNVLLGKMVKDGEVNKLAYALYVHPGKTG